MSVHVSSWVWKKSQAKGTGRLVLLALADMSNDEGKSWPSVDSISERCKISDRAVQMKLREAEESGELRVLKQESRYGTNVYQFSAFARDKNRGEPFSPLASRGEKNGNSGVKNRGEQFSPNTYVETSKEKRRRKAVEPREFLKNVVVVVSGLVEEFGLSQEQKELVAAVIEKRGLAYVQEKARIAHSRPAHYRTGAFIRALEGDWHQAAPAPEPPPKKPRRNAALEVATETPENEGIRESARQRQLLASVYEAVNAAVNAAVGTFPEPVTDRALGDPA